MFTSFLGTGVRRALILSTLINILVFLLGWPLATIGLIPGFLASFYSDIIINSLLQLFLFFFILWFYSKKEGDKNLENLTSQVEELKKNP